MPIGKTENDMVVESMATVTHMQSGGVMPYKSTKTFGHDLGLSAVFRQHRAKSHCAKLHGYALSFKFVFACNELDENGWVQDFGALKALKAKLVELFDHKMLVAGDDPQLDLFLKLQDAKLADVLLLPGGVGVEAFARLAFGFASGLTRPGVWVVSCECCEHGANSAIYEG